jgi:two-component system invasion response regulator UvrY
VRVLILTMHDSEEYANRAIQAGAAGFIIKGVSPRELPEAVRRVASGNTYITPSVMERMIMRRHSQEPNPLERLSERELQVLVKLAQGKEIRDITDELSLSPSTVGTYKKRIFEKLDLNNMAELIRFAMKHKLIDNFE